MPEPKYQVGDIVQVVVEPYLDCPFTWAPAMSNFCGCTAVITEAPCHHWLSDEICGYRIDLDDGQCVWCENCFEPVQEIVESQDDVYALMCGGGVID